METKKVVNNKFNNVSDEKSPNIPLTPLSEQLENLDSLWNTLSECLLELEHTPDHHAVLVLQVDIFNIYFYWCCAYCYLNFSLQLKHSSWFILLNKKIIQQIMLAEQLRIVRII